MRWIVISRWADPLVRTSARSIDRPWTLWSHWLYIYKCICTLYIYIYIYTNPHPVWLKVEAYLSSLSASSKVSTHKDLALVGSRIKYICMHDIHAHSMIYLVGSAFLKSFTTKNNLPNFWPMGSPLLAPPRSRSQPYGTFHITKENKVLAQRIFAAVISTDPEGRWAITKDDYRWGEEEAMRIDADRSLPGATQDVADAFHDLSWFVVCRLTEPIQEQIECMAKKDLVEMVISKHYIMEEVIQLVKDIHASGRGDPLPCQCGWWGLEEPTHTTNVLGTCCRTLARRGRFRLIDTLHWFPQAGINPLQLRSGYHSAWSIPGFQQDFTSQSRNSSQHFP